MPSEIAVSCLFLASIEIGEKPINPSPRDEREGELTWLELFNEMHEERIIGIVYN